jgi:hypothetical protein
MYFVTEFGNSKPNTYKMINDNIKASKVLGLGYQMGSTYTN